MSRINVDRQSQYRTGTAQSGGGVKPSQQPMFNPAMYQSVSRAPMASAANSVPPSSQADVSYRPKTPSQLSQLMGGANQKSSMNSLLNPYGNKSGNTRPYTTMEINPFKDLTSGQQSKQPAFTTMEYEPQLGGASNRQAFMPMSNGGSPQLLAYAGSRYPGSVKIRPEQGNIASPIVTSSNSMRPPSYNSQYKYTDPIVGQYLLRDKEFPEGFKGYAGPSPKDLNYADAVDNMTDSQLDDHIRIQFNKKLDGPGYNEFFPNYGFLKNLPPDFHGLLGPQYRRTRWGAELIKDDGSKVESNKTSSPSGSSQQRQAPGQALPPSPQLPATQPKPLSPLGQFMEGASGQPMGAGSVSLLPGSMNSLGISYAPRSAQPSSTTPSSPQQSQVPPRQTVSVPYGDELVGPYSAERALADFNAEAARLDAKPQESFYDLVNQAIDEGVAQGRQQGVSDANKTVDQNLAGSQGYYATPSQRRSGFFTQGMGALPSDAAIMAAQNQPLGDGGPAAAAARADQERRRKEAEDAMQGVPSDGLTRYMPNADLMAFANADRAKEDQQRLQSLMNSGIVRRPESGSTGMETTYGREPLKAMTPAEIQFYRHKMSMETNPVYAARINAKREARSADLANQTKTRLEMAANRRQAAADAAGASQQLRNFMAGRGAIGGGQDGFNALMSMAAMQNPNQAFDDYGSAYRAVNEPDMLERRFKMQQDLNDIEVKRQRDSEIRKSQMEILTDPNIPGYQKAQMMELAQDPTQIGSPEFSSLMRPKFQPDPGKDKIENYVDAQKYFSQYSIPVNEQQAILSQHGLMLDEQDKAEARKRGSLFSDFEGVESLGGFDLGQTEGMRRIQSIPFFAGAGPMANWGVNQFMRMIGMSPADMAERERYRQAGEYNNNNNTRK